MVYCTGLENRRTETFRGFESRPLRHSLGMNNLGSWIGGFSSKSEQKSEHTSRSFPSFHLIPERGGGGHQIHQRRDVDALGHPDLWCFEG